MTKQYIARQSVGRFHSGDIVGGLSDAHIQELLVRGVIEEVKETSETKQATPNKTTKEVKVDG
ncbi:hypothetical protein [Acinetobacter ursingii]|uniref:Uncharacterized protein n=1 Tax=Acinetobacter ursingii TaxID=108980 RepID=A0AA46NFR9_9GAMM|nr:hypothetical protein [Acinetobacter ursingii]UYF73022.1 hypothetical protein LSO60_07155 [Acinetobacter ursingii]